MYYFCKCKLPKTRGKMKRYICFLCIMLTISCSVKGKPVFTKVDNVNVLSIKRDTLELGATLFFKNPNIVGGEIQINDVKVSIDKKEVAQVISNKVPVPANEAFQIPIKARIPLSEIFGEGKDNIIKGMLGALFTKKIKVQFEGSVTYELIGFSHTYFINQIEEIDIK